METYPFLIKKNIHMMLNKTQTKRYCVFIPFNLVICSYLYIYINAEYIRRIIQIYGRLTSTQVDCMHHAFEKHCNACTWMWHTFTLNINDYMDLMRTTSACVEILYVTWKQFAILLGAFHNYVFSDMALV